MDVILRIAWWFRTLCAVLAGLLGKFSYECAQVQDAGWAVATGMVAGVFFCIAIIGIFAQP